MGQKAHKLLMHGLFLRFAGLKEPVSAIGELMKEDGTM